jgi:two-component system response regulator AlgR
VSAPGPLRVFVVDDEAPARSRLRVLLKDVERELPNALVGEAENGVAAIDRIQETEADVALIDIRMPVMDGIECARHLGKLARAPAVVFVTAYDQYAVQAFELNAIDYLLKPVRAQRLVAALQKVQPRVPVDPVRLAALGGESRQHLSSSERGRILLVPVTDILYLRAELKYVTARTREREFVLEESLAQLEQEFPDRFVRAHRNCLVAREQIAGFERDTGEDAEGRWRVLLKGCGEKILVSRRQWPNLRSAAGAG